MHAPLPKLPAQRCRFAEKIYRDEIWCRGEFVRKGSFDIVISRMEHGLSDLRNEITGRLDKLANRLDGHRPAQSRQSKILK